MKLFLEYGIKVFHMFQEKMSCACWLHWFLKSFSTRFHYLFLYLKYLNEFLLCKKINLEACTFLWTASQGQFHLQSLGCCIPSVVSSTVLEALQPSWAALRWAWGVAVNGGEGWESTICRWRHFGPCPTSCGTCAIYGNMSAIVRFNLPCEKLPIECIFFSLLPTMNLSSLYGFGQLGSQQAKHNPAAMYGGPAGSWSANLFLLSVRCWRKGPCKESDKSLHATGLINYIWLLGHKLCSPVLCIIRKMTILYGCWNQRGGLFRLISIWGELCSMCFVFPKHGVILLFCMNRGCDLSAMKYMVAYKQNPFSYC